MNVIEVTNLTKRYGDHAAVDGVSFSIEEGEIFGILGPNGAGKTTTVESIAGLRTPDAGTIRVLGMDPRKDRDRLRSQVGVQLQESELPDRITVAEALRLFASFYAKPADTRQLIEDLGLGDKRDTAYRNLSGGQKQRLSIARAIVRRPDVYVFDDSFSALDYTTDAKLRAALKDETAHATVFVVAQRISTVINADRIVVLDDGRVVGIGTHAELLKSNEVYREIVSSQVSLDEVA